MNRIAPLAVLLIAVGCAGGSTVARVGQPAPPWTAPLSTTGTLSLASLRADPVYLNFFATWCTPCGEEAPSVNAVQKAYASAGLHVIGVDELEGKSAAEGFKRRYGLVYPVVADGGTLQSRYEINAMPVHVFIRRGGVIQKIVVGELSEAQMIANVKEIL